MRQVESRDRLLECVVFGNHGATCARARCTGLCSHCGAALLALVLVLVWDARGDVAGGVAADGGRLALLGGMRGRSRGRVLLLICVWGLSWHCEVDVDLELLNFLVDEAEGGGYDGVGSLDTLECEYTEFELVQCSWGSVLEGLNLQEEDGCCRVDAVGLR